MLKLYSALSHEVLHEKGVYNTQQLLEVLQDTYKNEKRHYQGIGFDSVVFSNEKKTKVAKIYPYLGSKRVALYYAIQKKFDIFLKNTSKTYLAHGWLQKPFAIDPANIDVSYINNTDLITTQLGKEISITFGTLDYIHGKNTTMISDHVETIDMLYQNFLDQHIPGISSKIFYSDSKSHKKIDVVSPPNYTLQTDGRVKITDVNYIFQFIKTIEENCPDCYQLFGVE